MGWELSQKTIKIKPYDPKTIQVFWCKDKYLQKTMTKPTKKPSICCYEVVLSTRTLNTNVTFCGKQQNQHSIKNGQTSLEKRKNDHPIVFPNCKKIQHLNLFFWKQSMLCIWLRMSKHLLITCSNPQNRMMCNSHIPKWQSFLIWNLGNSGLIDGIIAISDCLCFLEGESGMCSVHTISHKHCFCKVCSGIIFGQKIWPQKSNIFLKEMLNWMRNLPSTNAL